MISTPRSCPRRNASSSRASCSSSTTMARRSPESILRGDPFEHRQLRYFDTGAGAPPGHAGQLEMVMSAVNRSKPLVHVVESDAPAHRLFEALFAHAQAVVVDFYDSMAVLQHRFYRNATAAHFARQPVLDGILDERLQQHARNDDIQCFSGDFLDDRQLRSEP